MKINERQLTMLLIILRETLNISGHFSVPDETRTKLHEDLWRQMSTELKDVTNECDHDWVQAILQLSGKPEVTICMKCKEFADD